jgi:hypothetical protein
MTPPWFVEEGSRSGLQKKRWRRGMRDYFRVEDEAGERFWIYRAGDGEDTTTGLQRWFLHGIFG